MHSLVSSLAHDWLMTQRVCMFIKLAASCGNIYLADSNPQTSPTHLSVWLDSKHLQTKCIHHVFTTLQVEFVAEPAANKAVNFQHAPELYHNPNHKNLLKEDSTGLECGGHKYTNTTQKTCNTVAESITEFRGQLGNLPLCQATHWHLEKRRSSEVTNTQ